MHFINCYSKIKDLLPKSHKYTKTSDIVSAVKQYFDNYMYLSLKIYTADLELYDLIDYIDISEKDVIMKVGTKDGKKFAHIIINDSTNVSERRFGIACFLNVLLNLSEDDFLVPQYYIDAEQDDNNKAFAFKVLMPDKAFIKAVNKTNNISKIAYIFGLDTEYVLEKMQILNI